ncbi:MAG: SufE family protein, partial [Elioraea tepidiphila]
MDRYRQIIDWGRTLPPYPDEWRDKAHKVEGCQSRVWLAAEERDGRLFLAGASDAAIVSGLIALLLRVYSGRTPAEVLATDPAFLKDLGLIGNLSGTRANGVVAMIGRIREMAARVAGG